MKWWLRWRLVVSCDWLTVSLKSFFWFRQHSPDTECKVSVNRNIIIDQNKWRKREKMNSSDEEKVTWKKRQPFQERFQNIGVEISCLITMVSHERHVVSNHRSFNCLFNSLCGSTSNKHQIPHYWSFVRVIHRWPVNSSHKGPVTRKKLPFDNVIMLFPGHGLKNHGMKDKR